MAGVRVHEIHPAAEGNWAFRDSGLTWRPEHRYGLMATFDPFPAYAHDLAHAGAAAGACQAKVAPLWDVDVYVSDREEMSRSNGHSNLHDDGHYEGGAYVKDLPSGMIMLSGKRIPPHPAVTRYLVAHEYGHNVAYMLNYLRGAKHTASTQDLEREYASVRGLPKSSLHHGEGGNWHDSACEIMACDFRILVLDAEAEFWPHPGIPRPERCDGIRQWWDGETGGLRAAIRDRDEGAVA